MRPWLALSAVALALVLGGCGVLDDEGPADQIAHLADDPCAQGDEIARGQPIDFPIRIRGDRTPGHNR